jgi:hypothetical protein
MMEITKLEKAALITTGAAAAFKTLLWSLEASIDSTESSIVWLRVVFAVLSFVAFDLVIVAVVMRGWSKSGAATVAVAAIVSALIALDVAKVWPDPALHAAPAATLAIFAVHLMLSRRVSAAAPAESTAPTAAITQAVQVNVAPATQLPRTFAQFAAARAAEMPGASQAQIAAELGTSADTIRRMLTIAAAAPAEEES